MSLSEEDVAGEEKADQQKSADSAVQVDSHSQYTMSGENVAPVPSAMSGVASCSQESMTDSEIGEQLEQEAAQDSNRYQLNPSVQWTSPPESASPSQANFGYRPGSRTPSRSNLHQRSGSGRPQHPAYQKMIKQAIKSLKKTRGSSKQAIVEFIKNNFSVGGECHKMVCRGLREMRTNHELMRSTDTNSIDRYRFMTRKDRVRLQQEEAAKGARSRGARGGGKPGKKPAKKSLLRKGGARKAGGRGALKGRRTLKGKKSMGKKNVKTKSKKRVLKKIKKGKR